TAARGVGKVGKHARGEVPHGWITFGLVRPPFVVALLISRLGRLDRFRRLLSVTARPDHHQLFELVPGTVGEEEHGFAEIVLQLGALGETSDLALVDGGGWIELEGSLAGEDRGQHATRYRRREIDLAILESKRARIALPDHVLGHARLVAALERAELTVHAHQLLSGGCGKTGSLQGRRSLPESGCGEGHYRKAEARNNATKLAQHTNPPSGSPKACIRCKLTTLA